MVGIYILYLLYLAVGLWSLPVGMEAGPQLGALPPTLEKQQGFPLKGRQPMVGHLPQDPPE